MFDSTYVFISEYFFKFSNKCIAANVTNLKNINNGYNTH